MTSIMVVREAIMVDHTDHAYIPDILKVMGVHVCVHVDIYVLNMLKCTNTLITSFFQIQ